MSLPVENKVEVHLFPYTFFFYNVSILLPRITGNARLQIKQSSKNSYSKGPESNQDNQNSREWDYRQKGTVEKWLTFYTTFTLKAFVAHQESQLADES